MQFYHSAYFGDIRKDKIQDLYEGFLHYNNFNILLNFFVEEEENFDPYYFQNADYFLSQLFLFDAKIREAMRKDYEERKGETYDFIQFFLEELEDEITGFIDIAQSENSFPTQLLTALKIVWIRFHPDLEENRLATVEYTLLFDGEACNQVLEIDVDFKGEVLGDFYWES